MNKILIISSLLILDLHVVKAAFYMWASWLLDMMQFTQLGCGGEVAVIYLCIYPWWTNLALNLCHPPPTPPDCERQQQMLTK
jgi:hypothetical protein